MGDTLPRKAEALAVLEIAMDAKPNGIILNLDKARDAILRGVSCLGSRSEGSFGQFASLPSRSGVDATATRRAC
jgi:hypothetical protein